MTAHVHKMIRQLAKEMAGAMYERLAGDNNWYTNWKSASSDCVTAKQLELRFINGKWPLLVEGARATLAGMLAGNYPEEMKEQIMEALMLDRTLTRGRVHSGIVPVTSKLH